METITRLTFGWLGTQTPYFADSQIDPMDFALLTFGIKGLVISWIKQDLKAAATSKRGPITLANTFLTLHPAPPLPVLVVLQPARNSALRVRVDQGQVLLF